MASLTKKVICGRAYYYLRECQRVGGKPKIVFQRYLGTVEDVLSRLQSPDPAKVPMVPREADVVAFGAEAALYDLAVELDLLGRIDRRLPKREQGAPSVGVYLLLAAIQRAVAPGSKASLAEWHAQSCLRRLIPARSAQLSSQRFWDTMDRVKLEDIVALEEELVVELVRRYALDVRCLLFDCTNFFSFIDSFNDRPNLPQRGHSKEGRAGLRIVGMALLCSADFDVPLLHHLYPGNQPDAPTFRSVLADLVARCRAIAPELSDITLIFDKGNNAADNLAELAAAKLHFIGSLVPTQHPDLLAIPALEMAPIDGFPTVRAKRLRKIVYGAERTVLVTFNQELYDAQVQTIEREVHQRLLALRDIQQSLDRWRTPSHIGRRPTLQGTRNRVDAILSGRHMRELISVEVKAEKFGLPSLTFQADSDAFQALATTLLGKTLLFTDRQDWTDAQIVAGYRSQHHIESDFRRLKDPHHLAFRPAYHWTDQKLRVHAFTCVLALLLCNLLRRKVHSAGMQLSVAALLDELGCIREVINLHDPPSGARRPVVTQTMSRLSETQRRLYDSLDLGRHRAR